MQTTCNHCRSLWQVAGRTIVGVWLALVLSVSFGLPLRAHNPWVYIVSQGPIKYDDVGVSATSNQWVMKLRYAHFNFDHGNSFYEEGTHVYILIDGRVEAVIGSASFDADDPRSRLPRFDTFYVGPDEEDDNRWWSERSLATESAFIRFNLSERDTQDEWKNVISEMEVIFKNSRVGTKHTVEFVGIWHDHETSDEKVYWWGPERTEALNNEMKKWNIGYYTGPISFKPSEGSKDLNLCANADRCYLETAEVKCKMPSNFGSIKKTLTGLAYTPPSYFPSFRDNAYDEVRIRLYDLSSPSGGYAQIKGTASGSVNGTTLSPASYDWFQPDHYGVTIERVYSNSTGWDNDDNASKRVDNAASVLHTGYFGKDSQTEAFAYNAKSTTGLFPYQCEYALRPDAERDAATIVSVGYPRPRLAGREVASPGTYYGADFSYKYDPWKETVTFTWGSEVADQQHYSSAASWYLYRYDEATGKYEIVKSTSFTKLNTTYSLTYQVDPAQDYGRTYKFCVSCIPNAAGDATTPIPELSVETEVLINPEFSMSLSGTRQDDHFELAIDHTVLQQSVPFTIYRTPFVAGRSEADTRAAMTVLATVNGSKGASTTYYKDRDIENRETVYSYMVKAQTMDSTFCSQNVVNGTITGGTQILTLVADRGTYSQKVNLTWTVKHVGTAQAQYRIYRRPLGSVSEQDWVQLYQMEGTQTTYRYADELSSESVGKYYEYKVALYDQDVANNTFLETGLALTTDGFGQNRGVISGSVSYSGGISVPGVKVILVAQGEDTSVKGQFYALKFSGKGSGILSKSIFDNTDAFSLQSYVRPDIGDTTATDMTLYDVAGRAALLLHPVVSADSRLADSCQLILRTSGIEHQTKLCLPANFYRNVTLSWSQANGWTVRVVNPETEAVDSVRIADAASFAWTSGDSLVVAGSCDGTGGFDGCIDDVRLWSAELTSAQVMGNYDRLLGGKENNLVAYWPLDEGVNASKYAYDYSRKGEVLNNHCGEIRGGAVPTSQVPTEDQLSLYGLTNEEGEFLVSSIPFAGSGTTYQIRPVYGVHEFSPQYTSRIINVDVLTHDGITFKDVSSFPVSGSIYFTNTDIPVSGAGLMVDGIPCVKDGEMVQTDNEGKFSISVPIGDHYIQAYKAGHTFEASGRFPEDPLNVGQTYTFTQPLTNVRFFDNTQVSIMGRVVGGDIEGDKPLGFGLSKSNIGRARITLGLDPTSGYHLNQQYVVEGTTDRIIDNDTILAIPTGNKSVNSKAWYPESSPTNRTVDLIIQTDSLTGEFSVQVPPLTYLVKEISIINNDSIQIDAQDYAPIDVTNPLVTALSVRDTVAPSRADSLYSAGVLYCVYHTDPVIVVTQTDRDDSFFGEDEVVYTDSLGHETTLNRKYHPELFTYPVFIQEGKYKFQISAAECYWNADPGVTTREDYVPLKGVELTITNELGTEVKSVYAPDNEENKRFGDIAEVVDTLLRLDDNGVATYEWQALFPNVNDNFTRNLNISAKTPRGDLIWKWNDGGKSDGMSGVIVGALGNGNNFVTEGPDKVTYILRDPGGSGSYATMKEGSSFSTTVRQKFGLGVGLSKERMATLGFTFKISKGQITPTFQIVEVSQGETKVFTGGTDAWEGEAQLDEGLSYTYNTTTTTEISTSSSDQFVGAEGDLFFGVADNLIVGEGQKVCVQKTSDGAASDTLYHFSVLDTSIISDSLTTTFVYSQYYIENTLIPDLIKARNCLFDGPDDQGCTYESLVSEDDPTFGQDSTTYKWDCPSKDGKYIDRVASYNSSIEIWTQWLSANEEAKVTAIDERDKYLHKNYSLDGGTSLTYETESSHSGSGTLDFSASANWSVTVQAEKEGKRTIRDLSATLTFKGSGGLGIDLGGGTSQTRSFTLADDDAFDALSIDVYNAPDGFGHIFVNRGGQTSCPYEGERKTQYYEKDQHILSYATEQMEVPEISVQENPLLTGVPRGGKGVFKVNLCNNSTTGLESYFTLKVDPESNPNGLKVSVPSGTLGDGRSYKLTPGSPLVETIYVEQGNTDIDTYDNIRLILSSRDQGDPTSVYGAISDDAYISVHFVEASSPVTLEIPTPVVNTQSGDKRELTLRVIDYDYNYANLEKVSVQYKLANRPTWTTAEEYYVAPDTTKNQKKLSSEGSFDVTLSMLDDGVYPDGEYLFRAVTSTYSGVTAESEEITVVKDTRRPQLLGTASPSDGVLDVGDEISLTFNEDILSGAIRSTDITVLGTLGEKAVEHQVAVKADPAWSALATTEAAINLSRRDFTLSMWVHCQSAGTLLRHGNSSTDLRVQVDADGHVCIGWGGQTYISQDTLSFNKWYFLTMNCTYSQDSTLLSALVASDAKSLPLFQHVALPVYEGNYSLTVGDSIAAYFEELTLWDKAIPTDEAQADMYSCRQPMAPHLIGYWPFDEGHGLLAADAARDRTMKLCADSWHLENVNMGLELNGQMAVKVGMGHVDQILDSDDYALELWFRGQPEDADAVLLSTSDWERFRLQFGGGRLHLVAAGDTMRVSAANYLDNSWHHLALNVLRQGNATLYADGEPVFTMPASGVPALTASYLSLGGPASAPAASASAESGSLHFAGHVDELRLWKATLTGDHLVSKRYERLGGDEAGLLLYYPFEQKVLRQGVVYTESCDTACVSGMPAEYSRAVMADSTEVTITGEAPALKEHMTQTNLLADFTVADRKLVLTLVDDANQGQTAADLERTIVTFEVTGVQDLNGNTAAPVVWTAYVRQNRLRWLGSASQEITVPSGEKATFTATLINRGGDIEDWELSGLPAWLTASATSGTLTPRSAQTLTFRVSDAVAVGRYERTFYVTGSAGISEPFTLSLKVEGERPDWSVDPSLYTCQMNLVGQLTFDGSLSSDGDDLLAAFHDETCVGVASPVYLDDYGVAYVMMTIYGQPNWPDGALTFRAYDASTGIVHPRMIATPEVKFVPNTLSGSLAQPVRFVSAGSARQQIPLAAGWNWYSYHVQPYDENTKAVFAKVADRLDVVKNATGFYGEQLGGTLDEVNCTDLFMAKASSPVTYVVEGKPCRPADYPITLYAGWNWIGYPATFTVPIDEAFAGADPQEKDLVKTIDRFAIWSGSKWIGSLTAIVPGQGYMYLSHCADSCRFTYPSAPLTATKPSMLPQATPASDAYFTPVDYHLFETNMVLVGRVTRGGQPVDGVEVAAFHGDECRAAALSGTTEAGSGYVMLLIPGAAADTTLSFRAWTGTELLDLSYTAPYRPNDIVGSLAAPVDFSLDPDGISSTTLGKLTVRPMAGGLEVTVPARRTAGRIAVYDMAGRLVAERSVLSSDRPTTLRIPLPTGCYFVQSPWGGVGTGASRPVLTGRWGARP